MCVSVYMCVHGSCLYGCYNNTLQESKHATNSNKFNSVQINTNSPVESMGVHVSH